MGDRTLLFIHGVIDDDPAQQWRRSLDAALGRMELPDLAKLGYETPKLTYLDVLEAPEKVDHPRPGETYRAGDDAAKLKGLSEYLLRLSDLERELERTDEGDAPLFAPPEKFAEVGIQKLHFFPVFKWASEYSRHEGKRNRILDRVLEAIPESGDLVIVGHSLGSVVAADLIYHLPPDIRLRLLVTTGSPLGLKGLSQHLRRIERSFPAERIGTWLNLAGAADVVPHGRGVGHRFSEVLDRVVDTGSIYNAHDAERYLDEGTIARALGWMAKKDRQNRTPIGNGTVARRVPDELLQILVVLQHALRIEQCLERGERRDRYGEARRQQIARAEASHENLLSGVLDGLEGSQRTPFAGEVDCGSAGGGAAAGAPLEPARAVADRGAEGGAAGGAPPTRGRYLIVARLVGRRLASREAGT